MKLNKGYNLNLAGPPAAETHVLPEPNVLYVPLWSLRFTFAEILVKNGEPVKRGQAIARDPRNHSVPLLAPRAGTIRFGRHDKHLTLEDPDPENELEINEVNREEKTGESNSPFKRKRLQWLEAGAWQFFEEVYDGTLPNPLSSPRALFINTLQFEPYTARGELQIRGDTESFFHGLRQLESNFKNSAIYLTLARDNDEFNQMVRERIAELERIQCMEIPAIYPQDNLKLLARRAGINLRRDQAWGINAAGVLATARASRDLRATTERLISMAGPAVETPTHLQMPVGYPLELIFKEKLADQQTPLRIVVDGVLTGHKLPADLAGLPAEIRGLTGLAEQTKRNFLAFMRPGLSTRSYSRTFLGGLRSRIPERTDTATGGERRPCVCCSYCEKVCPAGIMPNLIHRHFYGNDNEEAERLRLDLCVECGLCSYVCPSKIDLYEEIMTARHKWISEQQNIKEAAD